jgi:rhamnosyl/mannosyltransferase
MAVGAGASAPNVLAQAKLRVLHVGKFYPPHPGGMESVLGDLCRALAPRVDVEVVVANEGWSTQVETVDGVPVTRLGRWGEVLSTSLVPGLTRFLRANRWDIIHVHHPNPMAAVAVLAAKPSARLVTTYHADIVRQRVSKALYGPILARLLKKSDCIHVASEQLLGSSPVLAPFRHRAVVIPFGISEQRVVELLPAARRQAEEFARWGGGKLALFVGRVVYYKGLEFLLRAMSRLDARLLVIGDGDLLKASERLAARLGLAERVLFLGEVDDPTVAAALNACDVFVLPSVARSEAFGLVLLEAMASGKPVVTTALPTGVAFVNRDGETGFVVPPADPEALANALARLLDDQPLRAKLGRAARARFEREFSVALEADRMLALYEDVVRSGASDPGSASNRTK